MRKISVLAILLSVGIGSAATAAQNTDVSHTDDMVEINEQLYPVVGMGCSVSGRSGSLSSINGLTVAVKQWYEQHGRIITCGYGDGAGTHSCYCNLGADCFVGDKCGSRHADEEDYCSSYTTPRAFRGRIVSPNTRNVGVPCNEIGMTCKCEVEECEGFMTPNADGTCPELPDETETQPDQESSDSATENPCSDPYDVPDQRGVCRPVGGLIDAGHIPGAINYVGRWCIGDTLASYQPHATKGYWMGTIYGHHNCPEVGADHVTGPYVQCGCGAYECRPGYTVHLGNCYTNAEYARITGRNGTGTGGANSRTGNTTTGQNSTGTGGTNAEPAPLPTSASAQQCPETNIQIGNGSYECAKIKDTNNIAKQLDECTKDDVSRHVKTHYARKYVWVYNSDAGDHACKSGNTYKRCACGISECEPPYTAHRSGLYCWDEQTRTRAPAEPIVPEDETDNTQDVTAEAAVCVNGYQTVEGHDYPCAKDTNDAIVSVGATEMPCREIGGLNTAHTTRCAWQNATATDVENVFACKDTSGNFVRCVYRITECQDNVSYTLATDGLSCQPKSVSQPNPTPTQQADTKSISELAGRLAKVENQFGLSKWRTADGEFNKARLASDLTAGVVLGTTGALVTSSVVKKKQVKEGFEALECTVGGQRVGDYGDKFHISGK